MSKVKKNYKVWLGILLCVLVIGFFFYGRESEQPVEEKPIVLSMDIDAERPFQAQIFWTEDATESFTEQQSVRKNVEAGKSHFEVIVPADNVHYFRFDFGSKPGKVTVKNIRFDGANSVAVDVNQFGYYSPSIQSHEIVDNTLTIVSDLGDPYVSYKPVLNVATE